MIETDGVSCCILLKRKGKIGKKVKTEKEVVGRANLGLPKANLQEEVYIDELKDYTNLQGKM